jgi:hypothetical protein
MSSSEEQEFDDKDNDEDDEDFEENGKAANGDTHQDDEEEEEDTKPTALTDSGRKRRASERTKPASYKEDDDDDDDDDEAELENGGNGNDNDDDSSDDDDLPLSALAVKPSPKPKKKAAPQPAKKKAKTKAPAAKKAKVSAAVSPTKKAKSAASAAPSSAKSAATTSSSGNSKNYEWASAALYGTNCDKGLLVQRLLCRWWYAYDWPATTGTAAQVASSSTMPETVSSSSRTNGPPAPTIPADVDLNHYDTLDGFPGVYICTAPEGHVGHLLDTRDASTAPTFGNLAKKSAQELQQLLILAIEAQKTALVAAEGSGTVTESELDDLLKWARKVNVTKADKEAATILKAHRLSLP